MNNITTAIRITTLGCLLLAMAAGTALAGPTDTPRAVDDLLFARKFTLEEPFPYDWCKEKPEVREGWILVLRADPELARVRQTAHPVLYVNDLPASRVNVGFESGKLILFVPGKLDLRKAFVYFGSGKLAEQVDAAYGKKQLESAKAAGISPFSKETIEAAVRKGGETKLEAMNSYELYLVLADLIDEYSPEEHDLAESFRP